MFPVNVKNESYYNEQARTLVANVESEFPAAQFDYMRIVTTPTAAVLTVVIDGKSKFTLQQGHTVKLKDGVGQSISVSSTVAGSVVIGFGLNTDIMDRPLDPPLGSSSAVAVSVLTTDTLTTSNVVSCPSGAATVVSIRTVYAKYFAIALSPTAPGPVRVGNSAISASNGIEINPGQTIVFNSGLGVPPAPDSGGDGSYYVRHELGVPVNVSVSQFLMVP